MRTVRSVASPCSSISAPTCWPTSRSSAPTVPPSSCACRRAVGRCAWASASASTYRRSTSCCSTGPAGACRRRRPPNRAAAHMAELTLAGAPACSRPASGWRAETVQAFAAYALAAPAFLLMLLLLLGPSAAVLMLSFTDYQLGAKTVAFIGLGNYEEL